ncbi:hypothetical protein Mal15_55190 [Stieleria maiorica]|uniref:SnoaL-like domain protein n=1 Tax=Stieleria maiorica TaxID=2795974 RepID=A0A5B9MJ88_9BACT|nr:hypothetical protein [Stieleria maiorica]QEG01443.1 hypothetical protein Mal15_55190 [Stieleria maiorica]
MQMKNEKTSMATGDPLAIADQFAQALDREKYAVAESLISDRCEYHCRGSVYHGPAEIVASYQGNGDVAKQFDAVEYESTVERELNGQIRVRFVDHLTHRGQRLTFRCEQVVEIGERGKIVRIEHIDLPGQTEALAEFKKTAFGQTPKSERESG